MSTVLADLCVNGVSSSTPCFHLLPSQIYNPPTSATPRKKNLQSMASSVFTTNVYFKALFSAFLGAALLVRNPKQGIPGKLELLPACNNTSVTIKAGTCEKQEGERTWCTYVRVRVCEYTHVRERMCAFHNGLSFQTGRELLEVSSRPFSFLPIGLSRTEGRACTRPRPFQLLQLPKLEWSPYKYDSQILLSQSEHLTHINKHTYVYLLC